MSETEKRAVLLKPGDVLLIGNIGTLNAAGSEGLQASLALLARTLGIRVALFADDITMDVASARTGIANPSGAGDAQ